MLVKEMYSPSEVVIFTWEEQRIFYYYAPEYEAVRVKSFDYWRQNLLAYKGDKTILITDAVWRGFQHEAKLIGTEEALARISELERRLTPLGRWETDSLVEPVYTEVILYEYNNQKK